jgi:hypothetical protein
VILLHLVIFNVWIVLLNTTNAASVKFLDECIFILNFLVLDGTYAPSRFIGLVGIISAINSASVIRENLSSSTNITPIAALNIFLNSANVIPSGIG